MSSMNNDIEFKSSQTAYQKGMNAVLEYIENNLSKDLNLEELSQVANFSLFHFHRQFRAFVGSPAYQFIQNLRLKNAAKEIAFSDQKSITEIAFDTGFENAESFSRAFKKVLKQTPSEFRRVPDWEIVNHLVDLKKINRSQTMQVKIIDFPETMIATIEHHGPEHLIYNTTNKFIEWRKANGFKPGVGETYSQHYSDPVSTLPEDYRQDISLTVDQPVGENPQGVFTSTIPAGRCAVVRHHGSRDHVPAADYLYREWLPESGEELRDYPFFFHYINVDPDVKDSEMITDLYLPIK